MTQFATLCLLIQKPEVCWVLWWREQASQSLEHQMSLSSFTPFIINLKILYFSAFLEQLNIILDY